MDVHHPIISLTFSRFLLYLSHIYWDIYRLSLLVPLSLAPKPLILSFKATRRAEGELAGEDRGF